MAVESAEPKDGKKIEIAEDQDIPKELKDAIQGGTFVKIPREEVAGFITIAYVKGGDNPNPNRARLRYEHQNIPTLALPTLLRKVANDIEKEILGGR